MADYDENLEYVSETQTLIGNKRRKLMDTETGEIMEVDQITKRVYGTKNFWKCYLMDFLSILGILDSRQLDVLIYILEHTNPSDNTFIGTYKRIHDDTGCSSATITRILRKLQDYNFVRKVQNGVWQVNPNIMMKGNDAKRKRLLLTYEENEQKPRGAAPNPARAQALDPSSGLRPEPRTRREQGEAV